MSNMSRRDFLQVSSAGAALGAGLAGCVTAARRPPIKRGARPGKASPNEKIVIGFIGVAGRGGGHVTSFMGYPDVEVGAICDVYDKHLQAAAARVGGKAKTYKDFRQLLDQKDIDAVVVATPPHWHALTTIYACQAGKDVYCEKPMCLTPAEGRAMVKAARLNHRVTQIGTQIHAGENYHRVVEVVRSGIIGKLSAVRCILSLNEAPNGIGNPPDSPPPPGLDWDMWLGPVPKVPFNIARFQGGQHRYFADLVGSWLHEMGPHIMDLPFWALRLAPPLSATAAGGKFATQDISTIPDTLDVLYEFPDFIMTWSNMCANSHGLAFHREPGITRRLGISFHGINGSVLADYGNYQVVPEGDRIQGDSQSPGWMSKTRAHDREFLDCVKTRELPSCDVEHHYPLSVALNLGNIAYKVGRKVRWDAEKECIIGDHEANELVTPNYRKPWVLPT
ncbi:MAG: Gfo/Idh/MocA family oxidoreductase [Candidatus Hydrogenedentes bacterium]|nr:Gfo/Idh/MocA family oxidoreductase [Candidatus Hydrogenedentota bacterium]